MSRLYELFKKYGTDKAVNGYAGIYECLFHGLEVERLLEVGIGSMIAEHSWSMNDYAQEGYKPGGSLRAWRDYFPSAQIVGIDIAPDTQFKEERIATYLWDSTKEPFVFHDYDIVIDDGSHHVQDQIKTLENLFPYVNEGGWYIVEDVLPESGGDLVKTSFEISDSPWFFYGPRANMFVIRKL